MELDEYVEFLRSLYLRITRYDKTKKARVFRDVDDIVALDHADPRSEVPYRVAKG